MTRKQNSALIIGCGYIGSALKKELEKDSWLVDGIKRSESDDPKMLSVNVFKKFNIEKKYDTIFYMISAGKYDPESYQKAYVKGLQNTIAAIKRSNQSSRLIFVSSTSLFSEDKGGFVNEVSPIETSTFSKEMIHQGEKLLSTSNLPNIIVRFSGIYGPGRYRLIDSIINKTVSLKPFPFISNRIHQDDGARILKHLAKIEKPEKLYIATDCTPTPYNEIIKWACKKLKANEPKIDYKAKKHIHMSNKCCSNKLLLESGYKYKYPSYKNGFNSYINELK